MSTRLARAFGLVSLITLVVGVVGLQRVDSLNHRVADLGENHVAALRHLMQAARMHDALRAVVFRSILAAQTGNVEEMEASERSLRECSGSFRLALGDLDAVAARSDRQHIHDLIRDLQPALEDFLRKATEIFQLALVANTAGALLALPEFEVRVASLKKGLDDLQRRVETTANRSVAEAAAESRQSRIIALAAVVLGLAGALAVSVVFTRSLVATERQLMDASRQAGMAEIATSVLHNVGNVLNSVNVSVTLVADRIRQSRLTSLRKALALLREHQDDLGSFVTLDPKGRRLPAFMEAVAEELTREQAQLGAELECVQQNVDHIKQIVAMQQSYAVASGALELLSPSELLEDALRMCDLSPATSGLEIHRHFEPVPSVLVDRNKALQILVNLISNARHALDGRHDGGCVTLRILPGSAGCICIEVADNGAGIPRENLTRIFQHGFTTRVSGHGFGLHSGANAAREMGGSLTVESDGIGTGARFKLELPVQPEENATAPMQAA